MARQVRRDVTIALTLLLLEVEYLGLTELKTLSISSPLNEGLPPQSIPMVLSSEVHQSAHTRSGVKMKTNRAPSTHSPCLNTRVSALMALLTGWLPANHEVGSRIPQLCLAGYRLRCMPAPRPIPTLISAIELPPKPQLQPQLLVFMRTATSCSPPPSHT